MQLIIIHRNPANQLNSSLLRFAVTQNQLDSITLQGLRTSNKLNGDMDTTIMLPEQWQTEHLQSHREIGYYNGCIDLTINKHTQKKSNRFSVISNGRFITTIKHSLINKILSSTNADLIALNVAPALLSYREKTIITAQGKVAGFRRIYSDSILPTALGDDWPHHIFIRANLIEKVLIDGSLPISFTDLVDQSLSNSLKWMSLKIGGTVLDIQTQAGLLNFLTDQIDSITENPNLINSNSLSHLNYPHNCSISKNVKITGKVILGNNVKIEDRAIIIGPTILGDNVRISKEAVIRRSIIGSNLTVPKRCLVQNHILTKSSAKDITQKISPRIPSQKNYFRIWPRFSYARFTKRFADIALSLAILILFTPLLPIIAIVIKLSSPGPIFFKHKRQGLHGTEFNCIKFRTMITGADKIQERLRSINQVDGPQFKLEDDPRVTLVGKFLRNTYIDEIPQFINVLLGQMSIVGPRPSPKAENSLCPFWRDARLSVKPGVTGMWQIYRTRQAGQDFQEWIYYDTKYVRNLSLRLDLSICLLTAKKLITNFIGQF